MNGDESFFRIQVRFSKTEYPDLERDLKRFHGAEKNARIRMLLRLGLSADDSARLAHDDVTRSPVKTERVHQLKAVTSQTSSSRPVQSDPSAALPIASAPMADSLDNLMGLDLDPAKFHFGEANP